MPKNRSVLNSPRLKEKRKEKYKVLRNKILLSLLAISVVLVGLSFVSKWEKITVKSVEVSGNKIVDTEEIEKIINRNLNENYLWIFSKRNFVLLPRNQIKYDLSKNLNRLKEIQLNLTSLNILEVTVSERLASYTWCGDYMPKTEQELEAAKCYFMNEEGYIFDEAPYFSGEVFFRFIGKVAGNTGRPSGLYFLPGEFKKLTSFTEALITMDLSPYMLYASDDGDIEVHLSSKTPLPNSPKIILKINEDLTKVTENLQTAISTEPLKSDIVNKYSSLLYIDLRFGNKVYFKFE